MVQLVDPLGPAEALEQPAAHVQQLALGRAGVNHQLRVAAGYQHLAAMGGARQRATRFTVAPK